MLVGAGALVTIAALALVIGPCSTEDGWLSVSASLDDAQLSYFSTEGEDIDFPAAGTGPSLLTIGEGSTILALGPGHWAGTVRHRARAARTMRWEVAVGETTVVFFDLFRERISSSSETASLSIYTPLRFGRAQIYIDGELRDEATPCSIENLAPGEHEVRVVTTVADIRREKTWTGKLEAGQRKRLALQFDD